MCRARVWEGKLVPISVTLSLIVLCTVDLSSHAQLLGHMNCSIQIDVFLMTASSARVPVGDGVFHVSLRNSLRKSVLRAERRDSLPPPPPPAHSLPVRM